ncbi:MAG: M3 family metallopeptidase [Candidatus Babeliaceae bacterium]|jgi:thimet oligopeptidase
MIQKNVILIFCLLLIPACWFKGGASYMMPKINSVNDVIALFPQGTEALKQKMQQAIDVATRDLNNIIVIPIEKRTFENTVRAYDYMNARIGHAVTILHVLEMVSPREDMRTAAHEQIVAAQEFIIEQLAHNKDLYEALKEYAQIGKDLDSLSHEERYYLDEVIKGLEKSGLSLPHMTQEELKKIKKELGILELQFETNINCDNRTITVAREGLAGLSEDFIAHLTKTETNDYVLGVDYPTVHVVLENCSVEATRKALWSAYNHRAYPANISILEKVIALRQSMAELLGFESFAALDIDDEMAENPQKVEQFLEDLIQRSDKKVDAEYAEWKKELPAGITLVDNLFKPWDIDYLKAQYKKKHFSLEEQALAEYFPMENTVKELLTIYEQFLSVTFEQVAIDSNAFWHPDVRLVAVYTQQRELIGYLLLDLHPRDNKYSHACEITVAPAYTTGNNELVPAVAVVLANFPKSTATHPALLRRGDVVTFFHEFGHALHALLGATRMIGFSGTNVKRDFVEMPSQMLEEWMHDASILKKVSKHYVTQEPLSDDTIATIRAMKIFDSGDWVNRQLSYSLLSLEYYKAGKKDIQQIKKNIFKRLRRHVLFVDDQHTETSFGHLMGYGAKYYSYLWSKIFALDMFDHIKQHGLLDPVVGGQYSQKILKKGGSLEPQELLRDFLGREPNSIAFFKDLGI